MWVALDRYKEVSDPLITEEMWDLLLSWQAPPKPSQRRLAVYSRPKVLARNSTRLALFMEPSAQQFAPALVVDEPLYEVGCFDPDS
jgi:hypothetical protein